MAASKDTSSVIMLTTWWLWKQRNAVIFDGNWPDLVGLLDTIKVGSQASTLYSDVILCLLDEKRKTSSLT
jgi:hypothetical protein